MFKSYKYCLLPTDEQKNKLNAWMGSCRWLYNLALETKIASWASAQKNVSCFDLMKQLTELRKEVDWLEACPQQSLESVLTNLDAAYTAFFKKKSSFPKFKTRSNTQSIIFRRDSVIKDGKIKLTKIGWIDLVVHRPYGNGEIRTVTVTKVPSGKYFVSVLVKDNAELPSKQPIKESNTVGVDVGIKSLITLSDGTKFDNPKHLQKYLNRLRIEKRTLSRRYKRGIKTSEQSKGWHKQRIVVAKLYEKITNKRLDFLHRASHQIIQNFDTICIENLNISGMLKNDKLAKSISDASWGEFIRQLKYKAEWNGKNILEIGKFDPSSKLCSNCGTINKELSLSDRNWICETCGTNHDRDINAAINIKNFGLRTKPSTVKTDY